MYRARSHFLQSARRLGNVKEGASWALGLVMFSAAAAQLPSTAGGQSIIVHLECAQIGAPLMLLTDFNSSRRTWNYHKVRLREAWASHLLRLLRSETDSHYPSRSIRGKATRRLRHGSNSCQSSIFRGRHGHGRSWCCFPPVHIRWLTGPARLDLQAEVDLDLDLDLDKPSSPRTKLFSNSARMKSSHVCRSLLFPFQGPPNH